MNDETKYELIKVAHNIRTTAIPSRSYESLVCQFLKVQTLLRGEFKRSEFAEEVKLNPHEYSKFVAKGGVE